MSDIDKPSQNSGCSEQPMDYLAKAAEACSAGDFTLGMHLYLAAYEKAVSDPHSSTGVAVAALREAWHLACDLKERSMAEHVFEKLEPYLTSEEISEYASALQGLALDRLEEYGFSREELQDMAEAISHDFLGADASIVKLEHISLPNPGMMGVSGDRVIAEVDVEVTSAPKQPAQPAAQGQSAASDMGQAISSDAPADGSPDQVDSRKDAHKPGVSVAKVFNPYDMYPASSEGTSWRSATNVGSGWNESVGLDGTTVLDSRFEGFAPVRSSDSDEEAEESAGQPGDAPNAAVNASQPQGEAVREDASEAGEASSQAEEQAASVQQGLHDIAEAIQKVKEAVPPPGVSAREASETALAETPGSAGVPTMPNVAPVGAHAFNYKNLAGYDEAVAIMRDYGFGLQNDASFIQFVQMMNEQHGLTRMPAADSILFRAPVVEDAARFVDATIGELGLPVLRMSMDESFQGMPVLCVTTDGNNRPRMNRMHNRFDGPAILVLEDLEMWRMPEVPENTENGMNAFVMANMTRGAREAMEMIRASVEDADVIVLATSTTNGEVEPYFYELLEPLSIVDIANPTEKERTGIWKEIMDNHPSMNGLVLDDLVQLSVGLPRYDIYMAAREAIEEAYKLGLVQRNFLPVSAQNIFDKLAACQPLGSEEYRALEEKVVSDFVSGLDDLENLLDNSRE